MLFPLPKCLFYPLLPPSPETLSPIKSLLHDANHLPHLIKTLLLLLLLPPILGPSHAPAYKILIANTYCVSPATCDRGNPKLSHSVSLALTHSFRLSARVVHVGEPV